MNNNYSNNPENPTFYYKKFARKAKIFLYVYFISKILNFIISNL